jgi:hypothetical protein
MSGFDDCDILVTEGIGNSGHDGTAVVPNIMAKLLLVVMFFSFRFIE